MDKHQEALQITNEVFDIEVEGIREVQKSLGSEFLAMVDKCIQTLDKGGKLVLTGIGKSGYIGKKISATLASVGSTSIFMHPVEALHGDLGMLQKNDILIAISYSGETNELLTTLKPAKRLGIEIIAITGYPESSLAKLSDLTVPMTVSREACPFNLAPTTTTTALLVLGDALAMTLLKLRGFSKEDYGRFHPGGAIGRAVTMRACDIMRTAEKYSKITPGTTVKDALCSMSNARCGAAIIADADGNLLGIFTDGDFRRSAEKDLSVLTKPIESVMTKNPTFVQSEELAVAVLKKVEEKHINSVVVVDADKKVCGLIDVQDLPGLKLM
ncbi:MAG: KpsF/GutQ family sugar-phosphate isomerase [Lentisphaeria bacterium]|nr:KpsF/GutQ family sugar-phosphate isomerase [Lentisphaeria bacterium]